MKIVDLREIQELRAKWEKGLKVQFFRETKESSRLGQVVITLTKNNPVEHHDKGYTTEGPTIYKVMRYFKLSAKWEASVDYEGPELNEAIDKIVDSFEG